MEEWISRKIWSGNEFREGTPKVECGSARFFPKFLTEGAKSGCQNAGEVEAFK